MSAEIVLTPARGTAATAVASFRPALRVIRDAVR